jgi:hypothetical protein
MVSFADPLEKEKSYPVLQELIPVIDAMGFRLENLGDLSHDAWIVNECEFTRGYDELWIVCTARKIT